MGVIRCCEGCGGGRRVAASCCDEYGGKRERSGQLLRFD